MNILALDLGNHTGVAWNNGERFHSLSKTWATPKTITFNHKHRLDRRQDPRLLRFFEYLQIFSGEFIDIVVFEDVQFASSRMQAHLWASFRTAVWLAFPKTIIECIPTGTLKKFATGNGGATKEQMEIALKRQHPTRWTMGLDDNAIDAVWLWLWAQKNLSRTPLDKLNRPN